MKDKILEILDPEQGMPFNRCSTWDEIKRLRDAIVVLAEELDNHANNVFNHPTQD